MSTRQTTEQRRAANAWDQIEEVNGKGDAFKQQYGSWARRLPSLIQTNGLGQALAFLRAKGQGDKSKHQTLLYKHVSSWVTGQVNAGGKDLLQWVLAQNSGQYRRATTEAIAYALWLRRFAEAQGWGQDADLDEGRDMARTRPLPKDTRAHVERFLREGDNLGLILDKFQPWDSLNNGWDLVVHYRDRGRDKTATGGEARGLWFKGSEGNVQLQSADDYLDPNRHLDKTVLRHALARWERVTEAAAKAMLWTQDRLVVGLGQSHTLEIALTLHPLYGFPYIPGTTLKGVARAAIFYLLAEQLGVPGLDNEAVAAYREQDRPTPFVRLRDLLEAEEAQIPETLENLQADRTVQDADGAILKVDAETIADVTASFRTVFGRPGAAGAMVFYDAFPVALPRLEVDIMNPHFPDYYGESGTGQDRYPHDAQQPNPVSFLTVAPGTPFRFAVGARTDVNEKLLKRALEWLRHGLTTLGVGGKTAAGYGYFTRKRPKNQKVGDEKKAARHYVPNSRAG